MNRPALFSTSMLLAAAVAQADPVYDIVNLGEFPGGGTQSVQAFGLNDNGQVVGRASTNNFGNRAWIWDEANGLQPMGLLPGGEVSDAFQINNNGQAVGYSDTASGAFRAFRWDSVNGMQDLGDLPGGDDFSIAFDITSSGQVVGESGVENGLRGFFWDPVTGMQDIGDLPGGLNFSTALAVNDSGQVTGFSNDNNGPQAFIWDEANGIRNIGDLPGDDIFSQGYDINNNGEIVGYSRAGVGNRAFIWDEQNGMQDLGVPEGQDESFAWGVNDQRQVVGRSNIRGSGSAFLWDEDNGMQDLNDLIDPESGWKLIDARDINEEGQIVGFGRVGNIETLRAFLLTPINITELIWDGTAGDPAWDSLVSNIEGPFDSNWQGGDGIQIPDAGNTVVFNDVAEARWRRVDLAGDRTVKSVLFDSAVLAEGQSDLNYILESAFGPSTLTLTTGELTVADGNVSIGSDVNVILGAAGTWDIASGSTLEMGGTLGENESLAQTGGGGGNQDLTKTGDGTLVFLGAQADMGTFTVLGGTVNIDNGLVTVADTTLINPGSVVNLNGGRFEFGAMDFDSFVAINGVTGSLAGFVDGIVLTGSIDVSTADPILSSTGNIAPAVDVSEVVIGAVTNRGFLFGAGSLEVGQLLNDTSGEIGVITGERMLINGPVTNLGTVTLTGGQVHTTQAFINQAGGRVIGVGGLRADGGIVNDGTMQFGDTANVIGGVTNNASGRILSAGGTTIFFDDVVNHGEVRTFENSFTVFFGDVSGSGSYTDVGTVIFAGSFSPGNSPGVVDFGGNLTFDPTHQFNIELGGTELSEFDRLQVAGDMLLDGFLDVSLLTPFELSPGQEFEIIDVEGTLSGQFIGLDQGALLGTFGGIDLFINYFGGDGNDVVVSAIPEPTSLALLAIGGLVLGLRRRRLVAADA